VPQFAFHVADLKYFAPTRREKMPVSLLKTIGPAAVLIASICLVGSGCSSSPLKKSSSPLDLITKQFTSDKKPKQRKQADTIPTAKAAGYTPNEAK
jgi:hypothetical protein